MSAAVVLDASALLVWMRGEPGADRVFPRLSGAAVSAANWSEVWQKLDQYGVDADRALARTRPLGLQLEPVTPEDAVAAARLGRQARRGTLSLGGRCCLALGLRLGRTVLTADPAWPELGLPVEVERI